MDSLKNLLLEHGSFDQNQDLINRLKTYIKTKHRLAIRINLTPHNLIIYVKSSSEATVLKLDLENLNQIINHQYKLRISMKQPK